MTDTPAAPTTPRWWGVEHRCGNEERVFPTLHWADEPEHGVGPRRAFECDACGDRYAFHEARSTPAEGLDVDALREAGWEPDFNVCASCHHRGGAHDLSNKCLICGDRFSAMSNDEKWAWGVAEYARLRSPEPDR